MSKDGHGKSVIVPILTFAFLGGLCACSKYASGPTRIVPMSERAVGAPGSVVFFSTRNGDPNNQIYVMDPVVSS